jgi:hypothetical protein
MAMTSTYANALAEARSCRASLADSADDFAESALYERLLLSLDRLHPTGPALYAIAGSSSELLDRFEVAVERMLEGGGDDLELELILAAVTACPGPGGR